MKLPRAAADAIAAALAAGRAAAGKPAAVPEPDPAPDMPEAEFTGFVVRWLQSRGWRVHHSIPLRTARGWATGVQGDIGLPDIVAARDGRAVFLELKSARGPIRPGQREWLEALGGLACVVRPADWPRVRAKLEGV